MRASWVWVLILVGLLMVGPMPTVQGDTWFEYIPDSHKEWYGNYAGTFPDCIEEIDDTGCMWIEGVGETLDATVSWYEVPMSVLTLDMVLKWSEVAGTDLIGILFYNASSGGWTTLTNIGPDQSDWTTYSFDITGNMYNNSQMTLRFVGDSIGGGSSLAVLIDYLVITDRYKLHILDMLEEIHELKRELKDLKDRLSDMPDFPEVVPTGDVPFVPMHKPRFLDPGYRTCWLESFVGIEYEVHDNGTGNDIALYSLYDVDDSSLDYARAISSKLHIAGSYTHLYINDTKSTATTSDDSVILDSTETMGHYDLEYAYNITVQTDSGSSIKVNRVSTMQIVYCRDWSERNGVYRLTFGIDNDSPQDWLRPIVVFTFPDILVNTHSIEIYDHRNRLDLEVGEHFSPMKTEVYLQVLYLNRSDSRGFDIQFTEDSDSDGLLVFTITDKDIGFTGNGQYYFRIEHRQETTAQFHGKVRIEYNCSKEYANKVPSNAGASVFVNRIGTDWFVFYEDEIELMVYDVLFESNSLNTIEAYFDFKDQGFSLMDPEVSVVLLILLAIFTLAIGIRWIHKSQAIRISDGKLVIRYKLDFVLGIVVFLMGLGIVGFLLTGLNKVLGYG